MVPTNQGSAHSKKYFPPPNVLVIHNLFVHRDDERVYAFSGFGLTEFYRSVSFWIGLSVPARSWAFGDGMSGRTTSPTILRAATFDRSTMVGPKACSSQTALVPVQARLRLGV